MGNHFFRFKQFTVHHDRCAMKVGTDGVLLGAWVNPETVGRILDIGTGSGLIALMLAQRSSAIIDGIDIDQEAVLQAMENAEKTPWKERLFFHYRSFQEYSIACKIKYDLVISNPPFHPEHIKPEKDNRRLARHSDELKPEEILMGSKDLLSERGRIALIIPDKIWKDFLQFAQQSGYYAQRVCMLKPTPLKNVHRILVEFSPTPGLTEVSELIIESGRRHEYSDEYKKLTNSFYLNF